MTTANAAGTALPVLAAGAEQRNDTVAARAKPGLGEVPGLSRDPRRPAVADGQAAGRRGADPRELKETARRAVYGR